MMDLPGRQRPAMTSRPVAVSGCPTEKPKIPSSRRVRPVPANRYSRSWNAIQRRVGRRLPGD